MFPGQEGDYGGGPTLPLFLDSYFYALSLACPSWPGYLVWASLFVGPLSHPPVLLERHGCKHPSFFLFFFFPMVHILVSLCLSDRYMQPVPFLLGHKAQWTSKKR